MQIGMVGLGRMGSNMAERLMRGRHECVVHDLDPESIERVVGLGATGAVSLEELAAKLTAPRVIWIMVPSGEPTEKTVAALGSILDSGDTVIDGGNTYFKDDIRRAASLEERAIHYVDVGTSGGVWGLDRGYCLMIGGEAEVATRLEPIFATLAPGTGDIPRTTGRKGDPVAAEKGYLYCGPAGAGHYVKMVHNGIEYGVMQAYAEGFDILASAGTERTPEAQRYQLPTDDIAEVWRRGSVIGSWLLDLTAAALKESPKLDEYSGHVSDSGEGRWTVQTAVEQAVPADVLTAALYTRFRSRQDQTFAEKILSAMRAGFGGHKEPK